jgi:hypothetical protein
LYDNTPKGAEQTSLASSLVNLSFAPKVTRRKNLFYFRENDFSGNLHGDVFLHDFIFFLRSRETFCHFIQVTISLFDFLLEDEFASNSSAGKEILRENGMVIQFLKSYLKIVGGDFLKVVLSGFVKSLCINERKTSFEIDPSRAPPDEIEANMRSFVDRMDQFIDYMVSKQVLDAMPPGIRHVLEI